MQSKILSFVLAILFTACTEKKAKIEFINEELIFRISKGATFEGSYLFKNTGDDSLKIISIDASCGCTNVRFPKNSIAPHDSAQIDIKYDSDLDRGSTNVIKSVIVETNTDPILHVLTLKGHVAL